MKQNLLFNQASALGKRLAMVLTLLLTVGIGQVWGAEQKFLPSTDKGSITANGISDGDTFTKYGFTISSSNGVLGNGSNYRVYTDGTFTISSSVGNITAISFTFSGTNTGGFETSYTGLSTNSWSATAKSQARITQIVVTYESATPKQEYTLTYQSGETSGTLQVEEGANLLEALSVLETPVSCDATSTKFVGWTTTEITEKTNTEPTFLTDSDVMPSENYAVYAVFAREESVPGGTSWEKVTSSKTDWSGVYVLTALEYVLDYSTSSTAGNATKFSTAGLSVNDNTLTGVTDEYTVTIEKSGSYYTVSLNGKGYLTLASNSNTVSRTTSVTGNNQKWTISWADNTAHLYSVSYTSRELQKNNSNAYMRCYTGTQTDLTWYEQTSSYTTAYYDYITTCSTETLVSLDPNGGTGGTPSVTATKGEAMPTLITLPTRTGYTFQGYFTAASGGTQYYNADGTSAKDWDKTDETFTLYAQWECAAPTNVKITGEYIRFEGDDIVLTVSGDNIATDATYEWKKGDQVINNQTTATLTINNCTISDAGNYTCTVSNGICSASNNYTVKMYRLRGLTDPEDNWTTDFVFAKGENKTATYSTTLNGNSSYQFKVHDGSVYYGNTGANPTMTSNNCTGWTMQESMGNNVTLQTTITGTYIFTLDYTDESNPTISVTYPSKQTIYFNPGTDYWVADNAKFTIYSWGGTDDATFTPMEDVDCGGIYSAEISTGHTSLIFIRYSDYVTSFENYWNKTIDLVVPTDNKVMYDRTKPNSTHLFLVPNSNWNEKNARFAAYFFDNGETWYSMYKLDAKIAENTWMCLKPTDKEYPKVIFCRMNPENTTNSWDAKWNQSGDLTIPTNGNNLLTVPSGSWNDFTTTWSTFYGDWTTYIPNHTVSFNANGHGTAPENQCITDGEKASQPTAPTATGYTFGGWYTEAGCTNAWDFANDVVTSDITLYAQWTANTNTAYTVEHYQENIDGTYPTTPTEIENLTGTTAATVTPDVKDYTGFTAPSTQTVTIAADGSTVVEYKYTRNSYILAWNLAGGEITKAGTTAGSVKFGAPLTAPTVTKSGLTFIGWNPEVPSTMPAAAAAYTAIWENCIWVETEIGDIQPEDEVVVTMSTTNGTYTLDHSKGGSAYPPAQSISVVGNEAIVTNDHNNSIWNIDGSATDGYVFYPNNNHNIWLYCSAAQYNVKVGTYDSTSKNYLFTIEGGYLKNKTHGVYIGVYQNKEWRHYPANTGNAIANQTLKFYKRVCLQEGQYWVKWMVNGQEYTEGDPTTMVTDGQITAIPDNPANNAIGDCADTFIGWSESNLGSAEGQPAPTDLFTTLTEAQELTITENKTFYAVFATAEGSATDFKRVTSLDELSDGTSIVIASTKSSKFMTYSTAFGSSTWSESNGKITATDNMIFTLVANGDTWKIQKGTNVVSYEGRATSSPYCKPLLMNSNIKDWILVKNTNTTNTFTFYYEDGEYDYAIEYYSNESNWYAYSNKTPTSNDYYALALYVPDVTYSNYVTTCCALAPATNLTVSGTTANSATLTWTAPSSTTGITKLQVRNAETDAVVVDNIAVNTTTATITGLTECTSYQYYVVSVGDCEVVSNTVTATPFSGAKTVNYNYNGGTGSPASFTTNCTNQTITLPDATRTGYDFNGWYTAETGGTRVGGAGDTYEPATSPVTLYAQWTKQIYSISFHANGGIGTMANQKADENNKIAQLNANQFTRTGYVFVGWNTTSAGTGTAYTDQQTNITLAQNLTLYAQWAPIVTLNDAGNEETAHPTTVNGTITLLDGANACDPYEFVGWTSVATTDWNGEIEEPALVTSPYKPTQPTTLYAVYKIQDEGNPNAFKLSFEGSNGNTYYVDEYSNSPLRGYSNITKDDAVTFIKTKMYPNDDTRYYLYMEEKGEYLYYNGYFNTTSSTPSESQGWIIHTVGDKIKLQSTYSYDPKYLYFSDRDNYAINIDVNVSGSEFNMLSAVTSTYVASPLCNQEIEIIFETGNGDFVDNAPATNPLTVSRGDVITLPTCEYPGYEFMGWLKDEQQPEPSDIPLTYYTGDYTVSGKSSSITFYAYYKAVPEEVEFTGTDDTELLMYYYDGANYYYASSFDGENGELPSMQNCFNATTWTFTNVGNMQYHIQDETGKYLGAVNDNDNDLSLSHTPKVWNFTLVNGLWKMVCEDSPSRALMYISTGKNFTNAAISNEGNGAYSYITLGICPYPTYTTQPVLSQGFSITNTAMVTSASGQKVKATSALTLETRNIELPCTFTVAAPNITFYDNTGAEVTQLTASAASEQFELHFAYKPTAENTMEYPTITITDDEHKTYTIKNRIYARSLPATFAIVAKVGNLWYALPSQGLNSTTPPAAYPVEVDDMADPTTVTAVPANADWSLRGVYEASRSDATKDRYVANGDNLVFVNNASPAMVLNASSSEKENYLLTDAQYNNYYSTNPGLYEWTPTTTDLETYQLTNEQRSRKLSVNTATIFGVHAQNKAVEQVRFLPIQNRYTPAALQVVEWKENSIVVMYNGDPAQTASVSVNGAAAQNTKLSDEQSQCDIAVYELAATGLAANPTQRLSITIGTDKVILPIPYIISGAQTDLALLPGSTVAARQEVAKVADLVILKDAMLTAAGSKSDPYKFRNVTIYGGGKLVIPSEKGFGVSSLTMRVGAVESGNYKALYPQLVLNGSINTGNINIDYLTTYDRYYALSLPYQADTRDILYPAEIYGDNLKTGNKASFALQWYNGEARASETRKGWTDLQEPATLEPYKGYTFWGAPRKVSVNGESKRQNFGIHRIPIKPKVIDLITGETTGKQINVYAHPAVNAYDAGWNFLGNPYLAQYGNMEDEHTSGLLGMLTQNPETGVWEHTGNYRYITLTDDGKTYWQTPVSEAELYPFNTFFVQAGENGAVSFNASNRASLPARHYAAQQEAAKEITTGIILTGNDQTDRTGLLIADNFTEEYDFNADLSKFENSGINLYTIGKDGKLAFMAINQALAEQPIPLGYSAPTDGEYTIAFDEDRYNATDISALYLIDYDRNEKTNLLHTDYSFVTAAGTNNERFALQVAFIPQNATSVEWVDDATIQVAVDGKNLLLNNLPTDAGVQVFDALGRVIYATPSAPTEMQITLPTGYYLVRIADKQHAIVINTIIP